MEDNVEVSRAIAYKVLANLVDKYPEDAIGVLKDIMVDYWLFPNGDGQENSQLSEMDQEIAALVAGGKKIEAIKRCREITGMGLKEAKDYVEGKGWPVGAGRSEQALNMQKQYVGKILERLNKDFRLE